MLVAAGGAPRREADGAKDAQKGRRRPPSSAAASDGDAAARPAWTGGGRPSARGAVHVRGNVRGNSRGNSRGSVRGNARGNIVRGHARGEHRGTRDGGGHANGRGRTNAQLRRGGSVPGLRLRGAGNDDDDDDGDDDEGNDGGNGEDDDADLGEDGGVHGGPTERRHEQRDFGGDRAEEGDATRRRRRDSEPPSGSAGRGDDGEAGGKRRRGPPPPSSAPPSAVFGPFEQAYRALVEERWAPEKGLLNLAGLADAPFHGLRVDVRNARFVRALVAALGGARAAARVGALDLRRGRLASLVGIELLLDALPNVASINLGANELGALADLAPLLDRPQLQELVLAGNPLAARPLYSEYVRAHFPQLELLDGAPAAPILALDLPASLMNGAALPTAGSCALASGDVAAAFVNNYFRQFDAHRDGLIDMYADDASFALVLAPPLAAEPALRAFAAADANVLASATAAAPQAGRLGIVNLLRGLPGSKHATESFVVDTWPVLAGAALAVAVCGRVHLPAASAVLPFHRVFVLRATATASYSIASDIWTLQYPSTGGSPGLEFSG